MDNSIIITGIIAWLITGIITTKVIKEKSKSYYEKMVACVSKLENNPNDPNNYNQLINHLSNNVIVVDLSYIDLLERILRIVENDSSNIKSWELFNKTLTNIFYLYFYNKNNFFLDISNSKWEDIALKAINLLPDYFFKELKNQQIKNYIFSLFQEKLTFSDSEIVFGAKKLILKAFTKDATQRMYNTSLTMLANNPSDQNIKILALDLGRLHYKVSRPDNAVTIYDEEAIQNDISVRFN